jgi:hypothetical protein
MALYHLQRLFSVEFFDRITFGELEVIVEETVMASWHLPGGTGENNGKPSSEKSVLAKNGIGYLVKEFSALQHPGLSQCSQKPAIVYSLQPVQSRSHLHAPFMQYIL